MFRLKDKLALKENDIALILLSVVLACITGFLFLFDRTENKRETARLTQLAQELKQMQEREEEEAQQRKYLEENDSFYQRLADGLDTRIMIVGDSIGNGRGASDREHAWYTLLEHRLEETYGIDAEMVNLSMNDNTAYSGYVNVMRQDEKDPFHLAVICFGEDDRVNNFNIYYEAVIRAIQKKFPKCTIIAIAENSSRSYTQNVQTINNLCYLYGIPCVDTVSAAEYRENGYDGLLNDALYPTDEGQQLYADTVFSVMEANVSQYADNPNPIEAPDDEDVLWLTEMTEITADQFERDGNVYTYTVSGKAIRGKAVGIDYNYVTGNNNCQIYFDNGGSAGQAVFSNTLIYDSEDDLNGSNPHHVRVLNTWISDWGTLSNIMLSAGERIRVVFPDNITGTEQADSFRGILISNAE